jgi:Rha family phage regulatory protein
VDLLNRRFRDPVYQLDTSTAMSLVAFDGGFHPLSRSYTMNTQVTTEFHPHVAIINGQIKTTSLKIAEHFNKQHKDVLRKIQNLDCSPEFNERNFTQVEYIDTKGEKQPAYEITRDGFVFLAMGFTGNQAAQWKEAYINAFNHLENRQAKEPPKPSIETFQVKILTTFTRNQEPSQQIVPYGSCVVSGEDLTHVLTFLDEFVPVEFLPDILEAVTQRLVRHVKHVTRSTSPTQKN